MFEVNEQKFDTQLEADDTLLEALLGIVQGQDEEEGEESDDTPELPAAHFAAPSEEVEEVQSLDDIFGELIAEGNAVTSAKANRAKLKRLPVGSPEAAAIRAKCEAWEALREWEPVAQVALFARTTCVCCGRETVSFKSFMRRELSKVNKLSQRWVDANIIGDTGFAYSKLPKETVYQDDLAPMCGACAGGEGWPSEGEVLLHGGLGVM